MKMIIVALALVAMSAALPVEEAREYVEPPKIIRSEFEQQPQGGYVYGFETENGIQRQETGELREVFDEENKPHTVVFPRGSYSYINSEGKPETINYWTDEAGFHAEGDSIPKPVQPLPLV